MEKDTVIQTIIDALIEDYESFKRASIETRGGGSDHETRSEGKYDTRSTEANYLADGQARQAEAALNAAAVYKDMLPSKPANSAGPCSLVEIDFGGDSEWFFIGPAGGGMEIEVSGTQITVVTSESPLFQKLSGLQAGDKPTGMPATLLTVL